MKIISWNIARRDEPWYSLVDSDADIALVQEAAEPPAEIADCINIDSTTWQTAGGGMNRPWRTAVVQLKSQTKVEWIEPNTIENARRGEFAVSRSGSLAAAVVTPDIGEAIIVASMYAAWEKPHYLTGSAWIYADGSAHRLVSDLSALIGQQTGHRIIAAGDLNILHGYGENGNSYWESRYATVFARMEALGMTFVGPQAPLGRRAEPWPEELPQSSKNVPTFHTSHQTPATATRQLDFVFASSAIAHQVRVSASNKDEIWGPSDHCRVEIEIK